MFWSYFSLTETGRLWVTGKSDGAKQGNTKRNPVPVYKKLETELGVHLPTRK